MNQTSIYYGKRTGDDIDEPWSKDIPSYGELTENFICPRFATYDISRTVVATDSAHNYMEVCYANDVGAESCEDRNEKKTEMSSANPLAYNFAEELNDVLDKAATRIDEISDVKVVELFLNSSGNSAQEIEEKMCSLFGQDTKDIISTFTDENSIKESENDILLASYGDVIDIPECRDYKDDIKKYQDCVFGKTEESNNIATAVRIVKNKSFTKGLNGGEIYSFYSLSALMAPPKAEKRIIKYNNISLTQRFTDLFVGEEEDGKPKKSSKFAERVAMTVGNYKKKCEDKAGEEYVYNEEELETQMTYTINRMQRENISIDKNDLSCDSIFASIAGEIKTVYFFIEVLSIVLIIALSALEYAKIILNDNQDEFKKANKRLSRRIILLVTLFLLPAIINIVLSWFRIEGFNSKQPLCVNVTEK